MASTSPLKRWNKPVGFVGREALCKQREAGVRRRLVALALEETDRLLYHNEPIWRDGELVVEQTAEPTRRLHELTDKDRERLNRYLAAYRRLSQQ